MSGYLIMLGIYAAGLSVMGFWLARTVRDSDDFFVAGRRLSPALLFSTLAAANIGAGSTVGAAALGYQLGLSGWWWVGSAGLGSLILAFSVGPRIWRLARERGFLTTGDFLEYRYSRSVRGLVAFLITFGSLFILAGQLLAIGWILNLLAGTSKAAGCLIGGLAVMIYFSAGGLKGSVWVNLVQLAVILLGFLSAVPLVFYELGGWDSFAEAARARRPDTFLNPFGIGPSAILAYLFLLVPSFVVSPGLLQKIYGARDIRTVRLGTGTNGLMLLVYSFFPVLLGMAAAASLPELSHPDLALPAILTDALPFWLGGLLLAAVFSAEVSSADAVLFMISTSVSKDFYAGYLRPRAAPQELLAVARITSLLAGLAGVGLAIFLPSVIAALTVFYSLLAVALTVPLIAGLYSRRASRQTCLAAILVAVLATLAAQRLTGGAGLFFLSPTALGILASAAVFAGTALVTALRSPKTSA